MAKKRDEDRVIFVRDARAAEKAIRASDQCEAYIKQLDYDAVEAMRLCAKSLRLLAKVL